MNLNLIVGIPFPAYNVANSRIGTNYSIKVITYVSIIKYNNSSKDVK